MSYPRFSWLAVLVAGARRVLESEIERPAASTWSLRSVADLLRPSRNPGLRLAALKSRTLQSTRLADVKEPIAFHDMRTIRLSFLTRICRTLVTCAFCDSGRVIPTISCAKMSIWVSCEVQADYSLALSLSASSTRLTAALAHPYDD